MILYKLYWLDRNKIDAMVEGQIVLLNKISGGGKSTLVMALENPFGVIGYKFGVIR
jgi:chloramphenicol 3-O-phosphotransferase